MSRISVHPQRADARLSMVVQAPGPREATKLAAELRSIGADEARVSPSPLRPPGPREWLVSLTTPTLPVTAAVIQRWEGEMRALEGRWPGCRFLGFTTCQAPRAPIGAIGSAPDQDDAGALAQHSQRELVLASLRRRPGGRRGSVHRRGVLR